MCNTTRLMFVAVICLFAVFGCSDDVEPLQDGGFDARDDVGGMVAEDTADACQDGKDNDGDSFADCDDQDCWDFDFCAKDGGMDDAPPMDLPAADMHMLPEDVGPDSAWDTGATGDIQATDTSATDALPADGGGIPLAGCPSGCGESEICLSGSCMAAGPAKSCGTETYGTGLPTSGVIYVDESYGGTSTGTQAQPFATLTDAISAMTQSTKGIAVASGTYTEDLAIDRSVALYCRCPRGADGVTLAGTITIVPQVGNGDVEVTIDGCRIAPAGFTDQATDWTTCVSNGDPNGIYAHSINHAVSLLVVDSEIAGWCTGIYFNVAWFLPKTSICVSRTRLFANVKGLDVVEAPTGLATQWNDACKGIQEPVAVELSTVIENKDHGIHARTGAQGISLQGNLVTLQGSIAGTAGGQGFGIYLGNTETAQVIGNRIANNLNRGLGMANLSSLMASDIVIDSNTLFNNRGAGIQLQDLQASKTVQITGNLVRDTETIGGSPGGDGIQVTKVVGLTYNVDIVDNTVEGSQRNGVLLDGVGGFIDNNTISDSGHFGVVLQESSATMGTNTYSGNSSGDQVSYSNPVEICGALPIPIP